MCSFKEYPKAVFRGLCENDVADRNYTLLFDEQLNFPYFKVGQDIVNIQRLYVTIHHNKREILDPLFNMMSITEDGH